MSGLRNTLNELHQWREQRREARHGGGHGHDDDDDDGRDNYGSQYQGQGRGRRQADDEPRRPSYQSQGQDQGRGYAPPAGPPPSSYGRRPYQRDDDDDDDDHRRSSYQGQGRGYAPPASPPHPSYGQRPYQRDDDYRRPQFKEQGEGRGYGGYAPPSGPPPSARGTSVFAAQGGLDRGDFATDEDIERMVTTGEFDERRASGRQEYGSGYGESNTERRNAYGQHDVSTGPQSGKGYGEHANDYGRYDAPPGPPPGRGYQSQQSFEQDYRPGYSGGSDRPNQYGSPQTQGRTQYDSPQGPPSGQGRGQGNVPAGGFIASRGVEDRYGSGYGGSDNDRSEPPRRGEAASYYNKQNAPGRDDRYSHVAELAQKEGDDDPELYRRATQGLQEKIQAQQSRPQRRDDDDDEYKAQIDAHRKAYGEGSQAGQGPMSADDIGAAAAMEAIKQTAATTNSKAPAGGFQAGKGGGPSSKAGKAAQGEEEEEEARAAGERAGGSGGLQDKLMALAMSHAGKLFDKQHAGGGDKPQDKTQAMQSAAATAMQLFSKYQSGKLNSSDMSSVMTLAMKML